MNKHFTSKLLTLLMLLFLVACNNVDEPSTENVYLTKVIKETSFNKEELAAMVVDYVAGQGINLSADFVSMLMRDVDVAAIEYTTTGVDGNPVIASGVIAMPSGTASYDHLVSIQHGTLDMEEAPSKQLFYYEMLPVIKRTRYRYGGLSGIWLKPDSRPPASVPA